jgi:hypothetical protein
LTSGGSPERIPLNACGENFTPGMLPTQDAAFMPSESFRIHENLQETIKLALAPQPSSRLYKQRHPHHRLFSLHGVFVPGLRIGEFARSINIASIEPFIRRMA